MSLVPCRACGHQVDTSALACPRCGATDPGCKISRQQRNAIYFVVQLVFWSAALGFGGWYAWHTANHMIPDLVRAFRDETAAQRAECAAERDAFLLLLEAALPSRRHELAGAIRRVRL